MTEILMAAAGSGNVVRRFRTPLIIWRGPDGAGVKLARSGSAWGRATAGVVTNITRTAHDCSVVRERVVTPDGRVIYRRNASVVNVNNQHE